MKHTVITGLLIIIIAGFSSGIWFGWYANVLPENETAMEHALPPLDSFYYCPMHPQVTSHEPGRCPICTMDLVTSISANKKNKSKILFYRHPMDPDITVDTPQKDSMGMDFIPVYENDNTDSTGIIISPEVINNLGVRTAKVERKSLSRRINTVGYISPNESLIDHVHLRTEGWVESLTVGTVGDRVKKGQLLFTLYSPALVNAQEEYLKALERSNERLINASKHKLKSLGISASQINKLTQTREVKRTISIFSHHDGVVIDLMIRKGMYVEPSTETISMVDLSNVWLLAEIFEQQAAWINVGQEAVFTVPSSPDRKWRGSVDYIYPILDPVTRTLKVRLKFDNPDGVLKPNMFAHVNVYASPRENVLVVPREAVIRDGNSERVVLAQGNGKFSQQIVKAGIESEGLVEIIEGLDEGQDIVVSAQFLLDSEASLKAGFQRMQPVNDKPTSSMEMLP